MVRNGHIRAVDLFCGAGGLSLGFRSAGIEIAAAFDNWRPAVETYGRNLGAHVSDASIDDSLQIPECEIIAGGPPCQGFSSAGLRRVDDSRNTLVGTFARLIAKHKPKMFLFENVEGFLTGANGEHVFELLEPLVSAGYRIHLRKINAANFGVPQHRKRVIGIGGLGWDPPFPAATHRAFGAPGAVTASRRDLPFAPTLGEALSEFTLPRKKGLSEHSAVALEGEDLSRALALTQGQSMKDLPEHLWHASYKKRAYRRVMDGTPSAKRGGAPHGIRRLREDEPSKAITGGALRDFLHPREHRALTIREAAAIQTFPLDFEFVGSQTEKIQLIGNAVPPRLAERIGAGLVSALLQSPTANSRTGALLSFSPTAAEGMSPALQKVTDQVHRQFFKSRREEQRTFAWP